MAHQTNRLIPRDEAIEAYLSGVSLDTLRRRYRVCGRRLKRILQRRGVEVRDIAKARQMLETVGYPKIRSVIPEGIDLDEMRKMYASGLGVPSVARALGLTTGKTRGLLKRCGVVERSLYQSAQVRKKRRIEAQRQALSQTQKDFWSIQPANPDQGLAP